MSGWDAVIALSTILVLLINKNDSIMCPIKVCVAVSLRPSIQVSAAGRFRGRQAHNSEIKSSRKEAIRFGKSQASTALQ